MCNSLPQRTFCLQIIRQIIQEKRLHLFRSVHEVTILSCFHSSPFFSKVFLEVNGSNCLNFGQYLQCISFNRPPIKRQTTQIENKGIGVHVIFFLDIYFFARGVRSLKMAFVIEHCRGFLQRGNLLSIFLLSLNKEKVFNVNKRG